MLIGDRVVTTNPDILTLNYHSVDDTLQDFSIQKYYQELSKFGYAFEKWVGIFFALENCKHLSSNETTKIKYRDSPQYIEIDYVKRDDKGRITLVEVKSGRKNRLGAQFGRYISIGLPLVYVVPNLESKADLEDRLTLSLEMREKMHFRSNVTVLSPMDFKSYDWITDTNMKEIMSDRKKFTAYFKNTSLSDEDFHLERDLNSIYLSIRNGADLSGLDISMQAAYHNNSYLRNEASRYGFQFQKELNTTIN